MGAAVCSAEAAASVVRSGAFRPAGLAGNLRTMMSVSLAGPVNLACRAVLVSSSLLIPDEFAPDSRGLHCDPIQPRRTSIPQECAGAELLAGLACFAPIALTPAAPVS